MKPATLSSLTIIPVFDTHHTDPECHFLKISALGSNAQQMSHESTAKQMFYGVLRTRNTASLYLTTAKPPENYDRFIDELLYVHYAILHNNEKRY